MLEDINYDHPLYTPNYEDPYWENMEGLLCNEMGEEEEEEEIEEPKTPINQGIVQWEECPSPIRKNHKRIIVSIGKNDRLLTNLYLDTTTNNNTVCTNTYSVHNLLKLIPQSSTNDTIIKPLDDDDGSPNLENEDPKVLEVEKFVEESAQQPTTNVVVDDEIMKLKGKVHRDLVLHERDWRQQLMWREGEFRTSVARRHRDTKEWIVMEEKQRLRRVHEYSMDSVRDGKRRKLKLCPDHPAHHPLTPYHQHHL